MKSHTEAVMTMGSQALISLSTKQKVNARSSTEVELVAVDDVIAKILRTSLNGKVFRWNWIFFMNTIQAQWNLKWAARHVVGKGQDILTSNAVIIEYCPIDEMWADLFTKPLVGNKFGKDKRRIMNNTSIRWDSRSVLEYRKSSRDWSTRM